MRRFLALTLISALTLSATAQPPATAPASSSDNARTLWLHYQYANFDDAKSIDGLEQAMRRAAKAGYRYVMVESLSITRPDAKPQRYQPNIDRIKKLAQELDLEIVPKVMDIGYSATLLTRDPNLAEGMPVKDALFIVKDNQATLQPDPAASLAAGDMSDLSAWGVKDNNPTITLDNGAARISAPVDKTAKLTQKVKVTPFRQYHVSVRMKTQDTKGATTRVYIQTTGADKSLDLCYQQQQEGKPLADGWKQYDLSFNSQNNSEVQISLCVWGMKTGSVWYDDARIEEVGLMNLVRRPGAPISVKIDSGRELVEGADFQPLADPKLGHPFDTYHTPPVIKTIGLPDGTRLRVSYYHTHMLVNKASVMICPSEPKTLQLMADQARVIHQAWNAKSYMLSYDEIRFFNHDKSCQDTRLTPGRILADNVRHGAQIMRDMLPGVRLYIWSDMFDPAHNAKNNFYMIKGDLKDSWEGLDPAITVVCWQYRFAAKAVPFFTGLGHDVLMGGYYDWPMDANVATWLNTASDNPRVKGIMYCTYKHDFANIETYAQKIKNYKLPNN